MIRLDQSFFVYQDNDAYHFALNLFLASSIGLERGYSFNGPVWSISVEVVMYAAFFLLCRLARPHALALTGLSLLGFFALADLYDPIARGVGSFFAGGVVFRIYAALVARGAVRASAGIAGVTAGLMWISVVVLNTVWAGGLLLVPRWVEPTMLASGILFPLTILALALIETGRGTLGERLSVIGDISYSSYLWHFPLQLLAVLAASLAGLPRSVFLSPAALVGFFAALIAVSLASHRYLEMPAQRTLRGRQRNDRPR